MSIPDNDEPQPGEIVEWFPLGAVEPLRMTFLGKFRFNNVEYWSLGSGRRAPMNILPQYVSRIPLPVTKEGKP